MTGFPTHRRKDGSMGVCDVLPDVVDAAFAGMNCRGDE
jgi:hypothetical protein